MPFDDAPSRLKELLDPIARRMGVGTAAEAGALWRRWPEIVGEDMARHAEPTSLRAGVLKVRTDSPVWATEIGYLVTELKGRLNEALGGEVVKEVRVWTGPGRVQPRRNQRASAPVQGRARPKGESPSDPIEALEKARAAWARRRRDGGRAAGQDGGSNGV